jgi:hypothetical protein
MKIAVIYRLVDEHQLSRGNYVLGCTVSRRKNSNIQITTVRDSDLNIIKLTVHQRIVAYLLRVRTVKPATYL